MVGGTTHDELAHVVVVDLLLFYFRIIVRRQTYFCCLFCLMRADLFIIKLLISNTTAHLNILAQSDGWSIEFRLDDKRGRQKRRRTS